jgi:Zn-dependent protease
MSMHLIALFVVWYLVFVFSTTCHEAAHAWMAKRGGDSTAYSLGHVTLDPTPHIKREPFGMVLMPLLSFFMSKGGGLIGWASVPYDAHWGSRYPKRWAVMSLAGPLTNFLLAAVAVVAIHGLTAANVFSEFGEGTRVGFLLLPTGHEFNSPLGALALALSIMLQLNLLLGFFNLIPIPPLDGAAVVEGLGPPSVRTFYERFRANPMLQLLGMVLVWTAFPSVVYPLIHWVLYVVL